MASYYNTDAKNALLGGLSITRLSLHTGNPGATGADNEYSGGGGYARATVTFAAAADGERKLNAHAIFSGTPEDTVSWVGYWVGSSFRGAGELLGETEFDADTGILVLLASDTLYGIEACA